MAPGRGIVIKIEGDGTSAQQALAMVREQLRQTAAASEGSSASFIRLGSAVEGGVPHMAAASAALRALRGDFTENMRAGERFLSMLPGMESLLQTAFPVVGAVALGYALYEMGTKAYTAFENIVELKGALEGLGQVDITIGKRLSADSDEMERSVEQILEAKGDHAAALKQKLSYESNKPIDLSELFYDKNFSGLKDNIKTNYEDIYKSVAPAEAPEKLRQIKTEVQNLNQALQAVKAGDMGGFVPKVGGYGPTMTEDPQKYYEARIKAATDVQQLLSAEYDKRAASLQSIQTQIDKPPKPKHVESDDRFAEAAAALVAERAKAASDAQRTEDQVNLSELDAQHKMILVSDQEFYDEKLKHQMAEIDAEETALRAHQQALQALSAKQKSDPTLKHGPDGRSVEEMHTETEILRTEEQINALRAKRAQVSSENEEQVNQANLAAELAGLRAAAELEKQRNDGITAQIALIERETALEVQKAAGANESQQTQDNIRANGQLLEQKLRIADVERQIQQTEQEIGATEKELRDKATKSPQQRLQIEREINALHQQEYAKLQALVQQYDALAQSLGGEFTVKAQELHATLTELQTPDKSKEPQFGKTLADGVTRMADTISRQSILGKTSFHQMVKEMESDAAELTIKLLALKLLGSGGAQGGGAGGSGGGGGGWMGALKGVFSQLFSGGGGGTGDALGTVAEGGAADYGVPGFATGTSNYPGGPSIIGEEGPELWTPPGGGKGGSITPNSTLQKIAESGGGGKAPNVTTTVINQSSQPVTVQQQETSYDSQAHEFVQNVVLKDLANNGPIRSALSGGMGG